MENESQPGPEKSDPFSVSDVHRTVKVIVRHSADCPNSLKCRKCGGGDYRASECRHCSCPKSLLVYEGDTGKNRRISAKTRNWSEAERRAEEWRKSFDPDQRELKSLRAAKERESVRIEEAIALYLDDLRTRHGDNSTLWNARSLLGHINPETKTVTRAGHFTRWLDRYNQNQPLNKRLTHIADLTPAHLTMWRSLWRFGDKTAAQRWGSVKGFLNFCEAHDWLTRNPAGKLKPLKMRKGNRTAVFSDEQCTAILDAVALYDPPNVPAATRRSWQQRLTTFIELLRWSGMDLVDAVQYRPDLVADEVLRYKRKKTGELATVPLPAHLIILLRDVPLERDSIGLEMPFRTGARLQSDIHTWRHRLEVLFSLAEIVEVTTDVGIRLPHPKMFRDTMAVWALRHGAKLLTVSKMLGHSKTATTEKNYLPWVKELEESTIADARKALAHVIPATKGRKVVSIYGG